MIPTPWELALIVLAAWRVWRLLAEDTILDGVRRAVLRRWPSETVAEFMDCPYCLGFWVALAWVIALWVEPYWTVVAAVPWAVSAGVAVLATAVHRLADD